MDEFKVVHKETFVADLERITRSIAIHNSEAAHKLGSAILNRAERLRIFPERFPRVRKVPSLRRFVVHKYYKVFYRIDYEMRAVELLPYWDGRQGSNPTI